MKYVIVNKDWDDIIDYYCEFRTTPEGLLWMRISKTLKHAKIYDTRKNAQDEINRQDPDLSEHDILAVREKDLFMARLKG